MDIRGIGTLAILCTLGLGGCPQSGGNDDDDDAVGGDHGHWAGAVWADIIPSPGESASYDVVTFNGVEETLTASVELAVDWKDGTWTAVTWGNPTPGANGIVAYADVSEPWVLAIKGMEMYDADYADGAAQVEWYEEPLEFRLDMAPGETHETSGTVHGDWYGFEGEMGADYVITAVSYDESVTVAAGTLDGCAHFTSEVSGELIGGSITLDVYAHPDNFVIRADDSYFLEAELASVWQ